MFMDISGIDLFDQNVGMAYATVRHRCSWILLVLIYLIKMWVLYMLRLAQMFMSITGNDLLDQNLGMAYANVRLKCLLISLVLICLIKM